MLRWVDAQLSDGDPGRLRQQKLQLIEGEVVPSDEGVEPGQILNLCLAKLRIPRQGHQIGSSLPEQSRLLLRGRPGSGVAGLEAIGEDQ